MPRTALSMTCCFSVLYSCLLPIPEIGAFFPILESVHFGGVRLVFRRNSSMQDQVRLFHTPLDHSDHILDDLVSPSEDVRIQTSALYRRWVERKYQNADAQEYSKISDEIFQLLTRLNRNSEENSHLGFLNLVDQLVDLGYQEEDRNIRISQYLESMMQDAHSQTLLKPLASVGSKGACFTRRRWAICCKWVVRTCPSSSSPC